MSTRTTYYNLTKPDADEHVLRTVINQNYDAIDLQMHANAQAAKEAAGNVTSEYNTSTTYNEGDMCIFQNKLYMASATTTGTFDPSCWDETTIETEFERKGRWKLLETITADGTTFQYIRDLPAKTSGIMVICYFKATTQTATHFRAEISFDGTNYNMYAYIGNAITNADRYGRLNIIRDGNLWTGYSTQAVTSDTAVTQTQEINNACIVTNDAIQKIKLRSTSGQTNIESGSSFEIYIRR